MIQSASEKAAGLTSQLLAFARRQVVQPRVLDLNQLVVEIEKLLRRLLGEDIEFHTSLEPDPWRVMADLGQMEQVLVNLAINAREALPSGGELHVQTRNVRLGGGEFVRLVVRDTGVGMSEEARQHAFEPFFTTKESGRGLGLASCYGIVKQAGGSMSVRSKPGEGTEFTVDLPRTLEPALAPVRDPVNEQVRGDETVLVVEDHPAVRELIARGLRQHGYEVLEAEDGQAALDLVESRGRPIHAVVTDAVMPRMGGLELAAHLRDRRPEIKLLLISGHVGTGAGDQQTELPFLHKPFMPVDVVRKVRELLDA
jgi:CheY-like chemotaxis protein